MEVELIVTDQRAIEPDTPAFKGFCRSGSWEFHPDLSGTTYPIGAGPYQLKQVTTSWRTGRRANSGFDPLQASTSNQLRKNLVTEDYWKKGLSEFDTGHPFSSVKNFFAAHSTPYFGASGNYSCAGLPVFVGSVPVVPEPNLTWYGTEAIKRTVPTSPHFNVLISVAELWREGLPKLASLHAFNNAQGVRRNVRDQSGNFLSYQFGLKPLAQDIAALAGSLTRASEILLQYERDSGRNVRRQLTFPVETSTKTEQVLQRMKPSFLGCSCTVPSQCFRPTGTIRVEYTTHRRVWFSGCYTYWLPASGLESYISKSNHLFGSGFSPEVVWNTVGWTWLLDWFANIGSILTNVSRFTSDGLVMRYGYLMCEETHTRIAYGDGFSNTIGESLPGFRTVSGTTRKTRIRASPYGFGLNPNGFSATQKAILAALGLNRSTSMRP